MNILIVAGFYPMPDRASGELRFYQLLRILAERHSVLFHAISERHQAARIGQRETARYKAAISNLGIRLTAGGLPQVLRREAVAVTLFEFWSAARHLLDTVRVYRPRTRVIVDSVDVAFNRLLSKAALTDEQNDYLAAEQTKLEELSVYRGADVVVTVTDEDASILQAEIPHIRTVTIPNIHPLFEPVTPTARDKRRLVFIGGFKHKPNRDAVLYFCRDVLPLILERVPDVKVSIIGSNPTAEISALSSPGIEVLGYVPETRPYFETRGISIAPLRFGGGMKGKVGEAMAHALPVVTTSIGIEGFGLQPGVNVLVGDTPVDFAAEVISLLSDDQRYEAVRMAGYRFIRDRYSEPVVRDLVNAFFDNIEAYPIKKIPLAARLTGRTKSFFARYGVSGST